MQMFFESTHFGSVQHRSGGKLERVLRSRVGVEPQSQPLDAHVDPDRRLDPVDLMYRWTRDSAETSVPLDALLELLASVQRLLQQDARPLLDLQLPPNGKLVLVGDTHGQLHDVLHILHTQGQPSERCAYLFNGDVADRGPQAVEILILVLAFKLRFPQHVHFLRGNHENREINERPKDMGGGFLQECLEKYGEHAYEMFQAIFRLLPLFAVVQQRVFVVHAGLFRTPGVTLEQLRKLKGWQEHYPMANAASWNDAEAILFDAQWADPHPLEGFRRSKRGPSALDFGRDVTQEFLDGNGLSLCVRSHECPRSGRGFAYTHGRRLLTIFSASNYGGVMGNRGSVAVLREGGAEGFDLQVVEHDISAASPESGSPIFAQALLARRVTSDRGLLQGALGILLFNREHLRARCREADVDRSGRVPRAFLLEELARLSTGIDWEHIGLLEPGSHVHYASFLGALRVRWMHSSTEQAARLAAVVLAGELPLPHLGALMGFRCDASTRCDAGAMDLRAAAKLISPDITQWQLEDLHAIFGGGIKPDEFVQRLMLFAPPSGEPSEVHVKLGRPLRAWARRQDTCAVVMELFASAGGAAVLTFPKLAEALREALLTASPEDLEGLEELFTDDGEVDMLRLEALVEAMDANDSGTISFVELVRALGPLSDASCPPELVEMAAVHARRGSGVMEFVSSYRGALLKGCRFMDVHGSGVLEPEVFIEVAEALGEVVGQPLSSEQLEGLRHVLGTRLVPYALALSRFENVFERSP